MEPRKLIVGCTTIPSRTKFLSAVIDQIEKQTLKPDIFCIGIPRHSTREDVDYDIDWIRTLAESRSERAGFEIVLALLDHDYGPLCKLAGMLSISPEEALLITVDDDHIYDEKLVQTLVDGAKEHPGHCVCLCGHALGRIATGLHAWGYRQTGYDENALARMLQLDSGSPVDIISGWAGVLYSREMFGPGSGLNLPEDLEYYRRTDFIKDLHKNDDLYISAWLSARSVPRTVVAYKGKYEQKLDAEVGKINPLCHEGYKSWAKGHAVHFCRYWKLICQMEAHGYFSETARVPVHKSLGLVGGIAFTAVVAAVGVGLYIVIAKKKKNT